MALTVNTNLASINAQRNVGANSNELGKALERLSSGLRINRAADDAAGLSIATKLQAQVRGLQQAARNANNAISLVQTAEGALNTSTNILQRLRELAVQAASDDNTAGDRSTLNAEATQLVAELTRVANTAEFNGANLLDGSYTGKVFQIGSGFGQTISFDISDARGKALGKRATLTTDLTDGASNALSTGNITAGQVKLNDTNIVTDKSDDTVSVLEIKGTFTTGGSVASVACGVSTGSAFLIVGNGATTATVLVGAYNATSGASVACLITGVISTVNTNLGLASVVGVKLRGAGTTTASSYLVVTATGGRNLTLSGTTGTSGITDIGVILGTEFYSASYVSTTTTGITTYNGETSAIAKAAAVNAVKNSTSVSGSAEATKVTGSSAITAATLSAGDFYINGVDIGAVTVVASDGDGALVSAINAQTTNTGVSASITKDGKLVLEAKDGRNIAVDGASAVATAVGLTFSNSANVQRGQLTLNSKDAIVIDGSAVSRLGNVSGSALTARTVTVDSTNRVSSLNISTQSGAANAILSIDAAIDQINATRSTIGAVQSRVQLTIQTLNTAAENLAASESRIRDADFALETAKFTRAQILVQAGTAILAQANNSPQIALQLLGR
jgi:flagellin